MRWTLPSAVAELVVEGWRKMSSVNRGSVQLRTALSANRIFQEAHAGERCFILGTGPSINAQDLTPLKTETCISLNSFCLHKDYSLIRPLYHVVSGLAFHPHIAEELGVKYFQEIEQKSKPARIFTPYLDRELITRYGLFKNREVYYLWFGANWKDISRKGVDATKMLYPGMSVSVIAIQLALYMGFAEIYLLGLDHDWILKFSERLPNHFYPPADCVLEKSGLTYWDNFSWETEFRCLLQLWEQYRMLKTFAQNNGRTVYNATQGGLLDVFERVELHSIFERAVA